MVTLFLICFQGCSKNKKAEELQNILAQNHLPFTMQAGSAASEVRDNGQTVTFRNCEFKFNPAFMNVINPGAEKLFGESLGQIVATADEAVFFYRPGEQLEFISLSGMEFKMDESLFKKLDPQEAMDLDLVVKVKSVSMQDADFTPFLDKNLTDMKKLFQALLVANSAFQSDLQGISTDFDFQLKKNEKKSSHFTFTVEDLKITQSTASEFMASFYDMGPENWVQKTLEEKSDLFKIEMDLEKVVLSAKYNSKDSAEAEPSEKRFDFKTEAISLSYQLSPTEDQSAFHFTARSSLSGLKLDLPHKPFISRIVDIESLKSEFSLSPLSGKLVELYLDIGRIAMKTNQAGPKDEKAQQEMAQQMMPKIMAISGEFFHSKPVLTYSIDPLKHPWTTIRGNASFSLPSALGPVGKAAFSVSQVKSLLENLVEATAMAPEQAKGFTDFIMQYLLIDEEGTGHLTFEMTEEAPGKGLINGKPMK